MQRYCLIGPTHPFRGGISHYMTLLAQHLALEKEVLFISFKRQYPSWLFPGRSDQDPSSEPIVIEAEYILDPFDPLSWRRTVERIAEFKAEVVVIPWWVNYWAPAWGIIGRRLKKLPNSPKLLFVCLNVYPHEGRRWDKAVMRMALSPGDGFIAHATTDGQDLLGILPDANVKVEPLPTFSNVVADKHFSLQGKVPEDRPLLLFCGFVRHYKGVDILLNALPIVLAERNVHLVVAGEIWERGEEYRMLINTLGISDAVTLIDRYLPNEELSAYVDRAAVVVLPYRTATQSGIVQIAFGMQTPVITTNVGGLPESVVNEQTGLIVPPEDPRALAAAINRFFAEDLRPQFVSNINVHNRRFSWDKQIDALDNLAMS